MTTRSAPEGVNGLWLRNREQIETAWRAVSITDGAPNAEPLLDAMIELMAPTSAPSNRQSSQFYMAGDRGLTVKKEIIKSLQVVAENLDDRSETSAAAKGLLKLLMEE